MRTVLTICLIFGGLRREPPSNSSKIEHSALRFTLCESNINRACVCVCVYVDTDGNRSSHTPAMHDFMVDFGGCIMFVPPY